MGLEHNPHLEKCKEEEVEEALKTNKCDTTAAKPNC